MFSLSSSDQEHRVLAQVWAHLSADLQTHVIGLLAQLALNVVVARQENQSEGEEARHADPTPHPQNPS